MEDILCENINLKYVVIFLLNAKLENILN